MQKLLVLLRQEALTLKPDAPRHGTFSPNGHLRFLGMRMGGRFYRTMEVEMRGTKFGCLSGQRRAESDPDTPNLESLEGELHPESKWNPIEELVKAYRARGSI